MLTLICTLTLSDQQQIIGKITAESPQGENPITYIGAVDRLPRRHLTGAPADMKLFFQNLARELNARLEVKQEGKYDKWAR